LLAELFISFHKVLAMAQQTLSRYIRCWFCIACLAWLTACSASLPARYSLMPPDEQVRNWWRVSFKHHWADDTEPLWHQDALLAHQIVAPALERYRDQIKLWRFHRRAARDGAGHRFSFLFYATVETADSIYQAVKNNFPGIIHA
jgi:hypothetical protein